MRRHTTRSWLPMYAFAMGAALMFLYDPVRGRARRAVLSDMAVGRLHRFGWFTNKAVRDLSNRTVGFVSRIRSIIGQRAVPDDVLHARVRSRLGHIVSHPGALQTSVRAGRVTLRGPILASEADAALVAVAEMPGVREVIQKLEVHAQHDIPALQGGIERIPRSVLEPCIYSPGTRLLLGLGGITLIFYGIGRRGLIGQAAAVGGAGLAVWSFGQLSAAGRTRRPHPPHGSTAPHPSGVEVAEVVETEVEVNTPMSPGL